MRAVRVVELSGPDGVEAVAADEPVAAEGNLLIDVRAGGIAYPELLLSRGLYQIKPDPPFILGTELAGVVREAPEGSGFSAGDRVAAFTIGAFAEVAAAPPGQTFRLPDELDFDQGAGLILNYHTAHFCLLRRAGLRDGDALLVHGAGGGTGTAAIQVGKATGARVVAVVSSDEKEQIARAAGADEVARADRDWKAEAKELEPEGYDVIFDPVGGERFSDSIRSRRIEGRIVVVGFTSGRIAEAPTNHALVKNYSVVGLHWGLYRTHEPTLISEVHDQLSRLYAEGAIKPLVSQTLPLGEAPQALDALRRRETIGKVVLTP